jgi:hypothetical protein
MNAASKVNAKGHTYEDWMIRVNRYLESVCGLTSDDLPDGNSWDSWNSGASPKEYGDQLLEESGFPGED